MGSILVGYGLGVAKGSNYKVIDQVKQLTDVHNERI